MENKYLIIIAGLMVGIVLLVGSCSAGFVAARVMNNTSMSIPAFAVNPPNSITEANTPEASSSRDKLFSAFWQAWDMVHKEYVDQPVNDTTLMRGAIRGMMDSLGDQHTSYMDPSEFKTITSELQGDYDGIGAYVDTRPDFLTIINPMPGSPAEKAGLQPGDQIIAVDGVDMTGVKGETVRLKVIGPRGSVVRLTIKRKGVDKPFDVSVTRADIKVPSVETKMVGENKIGYIRLATFGVNSGDELRKALTDVQAKKPQGLILDLRNNGGGYLDTGIDVASQFVKDGVVMYEDFGNGKRQTYNSKGGGIATNIPLVILVNEGTASASEIVAGAVQDRGRGRLVGVKTYGKGSVQTFSELVDNQGAVRITIARWLTPKERQINKKGLDPDMVVQLSDEDIKANRDPQLDKAIQLLLTK